MPVIVDFPVCAWCKRDTGYLIVCPACGEWTCNECLVGINGLNTECVHQVYDEQGDNWEQEESE